MNLQQLIFLKSFTFIFLFLFLTQLSYSQDFITQWTFEDTTSEIRFGALTTDTVHYTWITSPSGNSGSGHFIKTSRGEVRLSELNLEVDDTLTISISPDHLSRFYIGLINQSAYLMNIKQWGDVSWTSMSEAFFGCSQLNISANDTPDFTNVTDMDLMFANAKYFNQDIGNWDVSNVTNMIAMFSGALEFNQDIGNWDVSNVTEMTGMFEDALQFNQDIGSWDVSNVTNMRYLFRGAQSFNQDIGDWNITNVADISHMFWGAQSFNQDIGNWDVSNVLDVEGMFRSAHLFNQDIGSWDVSNVTTMKSMFVNAFAFNQDIGNWDVSNVTNMTRMFANAQSFNQDIGSWDVSSVMYMLSLFEGAESFNQDISSWDVSSVIDMNHLFNEAIAFNQPLESWDVSSVTKMIAMFYNTKSFNQDIGSWDVSNVTNMRYLFYEANSFDQDISGWDVSNVTDMGSMFGHAKSFNQNLGSWRFYPDVSMVNMLDSSGIDCDHYSATLVGWQKNNPSVRDVTLGAAGMQYGTSAEAARDTLINVQGWTIMGDEAIDMACDELVSTVFVPSSERNQLAIYPNPSSGQITVKSNQFEFENLRVMNSLGRDLSGKVIIRQESGNTATVNLSGLPVGMYFLQTASGSGLFIKNR